MAVIRQENNGVVFHASEQFSAAGGVVHGFASRLGGVSVGDFASMNLGIKRDDSRANVRENYARFCAAVGADANCLVMTHQVHSDDVRTATRADILPDLLDPIPYETDGLVTDEPGLCLVIYYADCIPVLLYDPKRRAIGAVHSGWRGTSMGIVPKAVERMKTLYGTDPADVLAAIGPGIGPCCFETHDDVPTAMVRQLGRAAEPFCVPNGKGKYNVDLKGIIRWEMTEAGLLPEHIETLDLCTGCHPELWWSHRKVGDRRGNHGAMIQLV